MDQEPRLDLCASQNRGKVERQLLAEKVSIMLALLK